MEEIRMGFLVEYQKKGEKQGHWQKQPCYVVYGFYKEDEELPDEPEEMAFRSLGRAEKAKEEMEEEGVFESIRIEEEERELWEKGFSEVRRADASREALIRMLSDPVRYMVINARYMDMAQYRMNHKETLDELAE